jgi:hypothetical protein
MSARSHPTTAALVAGAVLFGALTVGAGSASAFFVGTDNVPVASGAFPPVGIAQNPGTTFAAVFPFDGTVTSWSTRAWGGDAGTTASAVILRSSGTGGYTVVARGDPIGPLPATSQVTSGTFAGAGAPVLAGDVVALDIKDSTSPATGVNTYSVEPGSHSMTFFFGGFGAVGSTAPTNTSSLGSLQVSVRAVTTGTSTTTCTQTAVRRNGPGGHDQADVTVKATGGLGKINNMSVTNGSVTVPNFVEATPNPVVVTTSKNTQGLITRYSFDAVDTQGAVKRCA